MLTLPVFTRLPPRVALAALAATTLLLLRADAIAPSLPVACGATLSLVLWSMLMQRLAPALLGGVDRLPLFFVPAALQLRSLRFVGWIAASVESAPVWLTCGCAAFVAVMALRARRGPPPAAVVSSVAVAGLGATLVVQLVRGSFSVWAVAATWVLVAGLLLFLSSLAGGAWFDRGGVFAHAGVFRRLAAVATPLWLVLIALRVFGLN